MAGKVTIDNAAASFMYVFNYDLCEVVVSKAWTSLDKGIKAVKFNADGGGVAMFTYLNEGDGDKEILLYYPSVNIDAVLAMSVNGI